MACICNDGLKSLTYIHSLTVSEARRPNACRIMTNVFDNNEILKCNINTCENFLCGMFAVFRCSIYPRHPGFEFSCRASSPALSITNKLLESRTYVIIRPFGLSCLTGLDREMIWIRDTVFPSLLCTKMLKDNCSYLRSDR